MNHWTSIGLALGLGILIGFAAGSFRSGEPRGVDAELKAQISALTTRLSELDARLASRAGSAAQALDSEQILAAVRTALAERDAAAAADVASRRAPDDAGDRGLTSSERQELRSLMESDSDPSDLMPLVRKTVRSLNP
jgi:hypothetical protein